MAKQNIIKEDFIFDKLQELKAAADISHHRWHVLYRDPNSLTDTAKRSAMLLARQDYQDAVSEYVLLLRTKKPAKRP